MTVVAGRRQTLSALLLVIGLLLALPGCRSERRASSTNPAPVSTKGSSARPAPVASQALRTCVDRWNQDNMLGWGSRSVRVAIRGLNAGERSRLYEPNPGQRICTISLADRPGDNTWICQIDARGGYECPLVTSDGMPPLRNQNGTTDRRGVLKLDVPLKGTHATPPLAWQRRYPHVDGFILPWTRAGRLRNGLRFDRVVEARHLRGACSPGRSTSSPRPRSAASPTCSSIRASRPAQTGTIPARSSPAATPVGRASVAS
jgi:hypothetical protein